MKSANDLPTTRRRVNRIADNDASHVTQGGFMTGIIGPFSNASSIATSALLLLLVISGQAQATRPAGRGFAKVDGAKLYYEVKGAGSTIVLIHGGQMDR